MNRLAIFGLMTYAMFLLTAVSSSIMIKQKRVFSLKWHKRFAFISLLMALGHGVVGILRYF